MGSGLQPAPVDQNQLEIERKVKQMAKSIKPEIEKKYKLYALQGTAGQSIGLCVSKVDELMEMRRGVVTDPADSSKVLVKNSIEKYNNNTYETMFTFAWLLEQAALDGV